MTTPEPFGGQPARQPQHSTPPAPGQYPPPGYPLPDQYPPPGQYPAPDQYPPPGQYPAPGQYPPPGYPPHGAAYGVDAYGQPLSDKSKMAAGLLQIFLGGFGIGRFYLGYTGIAVAQIIVTLITLGFGAIWGFIDGILILVGNVRDAQGRQLRD